ncbi:MAG: hypothetical protein PHX43_01040 [Alphaproteobacteria bacterium]|nr:hypothetical protein [Alphaproteobacteria bacterium]
MRIDCDQIVFQKCSDLKNFLWCKISQNGTPDLGGIEEEIILLKRNGMPISWKRHQKFIADLALALPNGTIRNDRDVWGNNMVFGGESSIGRLQPETNSTLVEFAHAPVPDSWTLYLQSQEFLFALLMEARRSDFVVLGAGIAPTMCWDDFYRYEAIMPHATFPYSWEHMKNKTRPEYCRTVFGTASTHHSLGFNKPDIMMEYLKTALRLQPTMIALTGNSPFWARERARDKNGRTLLSLRSYLQLDYGRTFGIDGIKYLYPDQLLDAKISFEQVIDYYLDSPLDRTFINGEKAYVGSLSMRQYIEQGCIREGRRFFPKADAINMMFRTPIVDVRLSMINAPRIEARCHDCVSHHVSVAIDAFYRGIAANLDEASSLLAGITPQETRRQRKQVCYTGLDTLVAHPMSCIKTQQDIALKMLSISQEGLVARGLNEESLLTPLQYIAESGKNPAQEVLRNVRFDEDGVIPLDQAFTFFSYAQRPLVQSGVCRESSEHWAHCKIK